MGTPQYAKVILKALLKEKNIEVVCVFTQPDKPVGRKKVLTPPIVKSYLVENHPEIPIFQPKNLKDKSIKRKISTFKPDFIVVAAYGQILPVEILNIATPINLHASILPKFRGASPIQEAILSGDKFSGVTAMLMSQGLDSGDMLAFSYLEISDLNAQEIFDNLSIKAANLTIKVLKNFDKILPISQFSGLSSKCAKVKKTDGLVKFSDDINSVMYKFRAYFPWPGIFLENGTKILQAKFSEILGPEGEILEILDDSFVVGFSGGGLEILEIQEVGKKALKAKDFINGKRLKLGDRIY
ncbi:MAG: methionyl-tRNA formyltransferase [Campylobacter sp.]|nr:methionyl-tRNA formyltransferase [Campylobacter sp.]